jgi:hypothetical protein
LEPPFWAALFICAESFPGKVFNTIVDNSVEKGGRIFVSDSARNGSALCTAASAGTFVVSAHVIGDGRIADGREEVWAATQP